MDDPVPPLDHLPDDPVLLKGLVRELLASHQQQQRQIEQLTQRLDLLLKRMYGPRADKLDPQQLLLYALEHEAKQLDAAARCALRQEQAVPLLAALKIWLDQLALIALPKSPLAKR